MIHAEIIFSFFAVSETKAEKLKAVFCTVFLKILIFFCLNGIFFYVFKLF
jgi:hypothetical protein